MEDKSLGPTANDQQASYKVISYPGINLPKQYLPLLLSKTLRSLRFGNDYFKLINSESYYKHYEQYLKTLITKSTIHLAVLSDDEDVVLGFAIFNRDVLHYAHVHKDNRRVGIGKSLLPLKLKKFSHITKIGLSTWPRFSYLIFDPFATGDE